MSGTNAVQGAVHVQMPSASRSRASEEATESPAEKRREAQQKGAPEVEVNPQAMNGVGTQLNLVA